MDEKEKLQLLVAAVKEKTITGAEKEKALGKISTQTLKYTVAGGSATPTDVYEFAKRALLTRMKNFDEETIKSYLQDGNRYLRNLTVKFLTKAGKGDLVKRELGL